MAMIQIIIYFAHSFVVFCVFSFPLFFPDFISCLSLCYCILFSIVSSYTSFPHHHPSLNCLPSLPPHFPSPHTSHFPLTSCVPILPSLIHPSFPASSITHSLIPFFPSIAWS